MLGQGGTVGVDLEEYPLAEKANICSEIRKHYGIPADVVIADSPVIQDEGQES